MSKLGWIHFSKSFRDRVNTVLDMMDEEGMVDELGVGAFRDAFADIFFPGISTIQTRAKYFFIVPYLIQDYLNLPYNKQTGLDNFLYDAEHELMWELAAKYNFERNSGSGVIGITKRPRNRIARRPSSIYWNGIRKLEFIKTNLSFSEYAIRLNETISEKISRKVSNKSYESDDEDVDLSSGNNIKVSTYRKNWKNNPDMPLEYEEADFFQQQIIRTIPDSLLGQIVINKNLRKLFSYYGNFRDFTRAALKEIINDELRDNLILAHDLDLVVEGLHWVYSNEVNKLHYNDHSNYKKWKEWKSELYSELLDLKNLRGERLINITPRAGYYSKNFIIKELEMIRQKKINYKLMAELVIEQEKKVKQEKSRFRTNSEKDFKKGEAKSLSYLNYRYNNARTIINDIFKSLKKSYA